MKKLYKATIKAKSNFATPLKGDTIFGQLCWSIRMIESKKELNRVLENYKSNPFCIVSDAFIHNHLPKPKAPASFLNEDPQEKKENRKKQWLLHNDFFYQNYKNAKELKEYETIDLVRNSINYKLNRTEGENFSPYAQEEFVFDKKDIYFLIEESEINLVKRAFEFMGIDGFGKDKNIGKGRFEIESFEEFDLPIKASKFYVAMSPFEANNINAKKIYYDTFVRFGKLGMERAFSNPFKKPIILADRGALLEFEEPQELQFVGKAIKNISTYDDVIHQGYAIVFPTGEQK